MIRIFIADDHEFVRVGMRQLLNEVPGFEVVGEATNGREVLRASLDRDCDVLVLDLSLPRVSGGEVLRRLRERWPQLPIVVHSMYSADQFAGRALRAGARAYVGKDQAPSDLVEAIRRVATTPEYLEDAGSSTPEKLRDACASKRPHETLTPREHQVFRLLVDGKNVSEIAAELDVHSCTVSNYLASIRKKLHVGSVAEVVHYAYAERLIEAEIL